MVNIVFAAGGSIGHIAPCVAVWRAVQTLRPDAVAHFVCSERAGDNKFLQKEGVQWTALAERRLSLWKIPLLTMRAIALLKRWKPDAVFTKGGGVAVPIALAAWIRGIPIVVHESDAVEGRATKWIGKLGAKVIHGFREGNPLRPGITEGSRDRGFSLTGFSGKRPVLLLMGGSQGAQALNEVFARHSKEILEHVDVIHITGEGKPGAGTHAGYWTKPFVHEELADLYAIADFAVSRAGAGSITELAANGIPAILVPLEGVAHDHQTKNAQAAKECGGCTVLAQISLEETLVPEIRRLAHDAALRRERSEKMKSLCQAKSDEKVAKILLAVLPEHCQVS